MLLLMAQNCVCSGARLDYPARRGLLADSAAHRRDPHRTRLIEPAVQRALGQSRLIRKRFAVNHDRR